MSQQTGRPRPQSPERPVLRDSRHTRTSSAVYARRRLVALIVLLALLGGVVAFAALVWPGFASGGEAKKPAEVAVTAPPATPTIEPVERTAETELGKAMPASVLQFALRAETATAALEDAGAIEGHELTYADGDGDGATTVTVLVGQWATDEEAEDAYQERLAAAVGAGGDATSTGDVEVGGETVGTYAVTPVDAGSATVTWRNGTVVLQATGPTDVIEPFYTAFPL
jgi:hypothetical protein